MTTETKATGTTLTVQRAVKAFIKNNTTKADAILVAVQDHLKIESNQGEDQFKTLIDAIGAAGKEASKAAGAEESTSGWARADHRSSSWAPSLPFRRSPGESRSPWGQRVLKRRDAQGSLAPIPIGRVFEKERPGSSPTERAPSSRYYPPFECAVRARRGDDV